MFIQKALIAQLLKDFICNRMYVCMDMHLSAPADTKGIRLPGTGVTHGCGGCGPPDVGARDQTLALHMHGPPPHPEPSLQPLTCLHLNNEPEIVTDFQKTTTLSTTP